MAKKALIMPANNKTWLAIYTQAAITGLTSNPNVTQDPEEVAQKAIQIALATCKHIEIIETALKNG